MRAKEIYDDLAKRWYKECNDEAWIGSIKRDYGLSNKEWSPDCFFLITTSWGPWEEERPKRIFQQIKRAFSRLLNNIRNVGSNFDGYPLPWQNRRVRTISKYLKKEQKTFKDIVDILDAKNGLEARDYLAKITGAKDNKKTISCFIRDWLCKDTFPIDRRITEMLSYLGLPNKEDQMVRLCEMDGIHSRILDRMLYMQRGECPDNSPGPNNECRKCKINAYCWKYILK